MKIGNCFGYLICDGIPTFTLGPHYQLFFVTFTAFTLFGLWALYVLICLEKYLYFTFSLIALLAQLTNYACVALRDPGIASNLIESDQRTWFCKQCNRRQEFTTRHCKECDLCIKKFDHHCPWVGKCIGGNNLQEFYSFIYSTALFMIYNIITITS
ncbi:hypothetical protein pb186bvf_005522 [Paramecium bursaria]